MQRAVHSLSTLSNWCCAPKLRTELDIKVLDNLQVDQPGSLIDTYVEKLELIIQEKSKGIRDLQKLLDSFKSRLQQEEVFSKTMGRNKLKNVLK